MDVEEFAPLLEKFVVGVRNRDGDEYCCSTLVNIVDALFRYKNSKREEEGLTKWFYCMSLSLRKLIN